MNIPTDKLTREQIAVALESRGYRPTLGLMDYLMAEDTSHATIDRLTAEFYLQAQLQALPVSSITKTLYVEDVIALRPELSYKQASEVLAKADSVRSFAGLDLNSDLLETVAEDMYPTSVDDDDLTSRDASTLTQGERIILLGDVYLITAKSEHGQDTPNGRPTTILMDRLSDKKSVAVLIHPSYSVADMVVLSLMPRLALFDIPRL